MACSYHVVKPTAGGSAAVKISADTGEFAVIDSGIQPATDRGRSQYRLQPGAVPRQRRPGHPSATAGNKPWPPPPHDISTPFIKRPIATSLIVLGVLLVGAAPILRADRAASCK
jgi:hypothetical protein